MNKEVMLKWIEALKSEDYRQCKQYLHRGDEFCATGVLCDLHSNQFNNPWIKEEEYDISYFSYFDRECTIALEVKEWIGCEFHLSVIMNMNDRGMSFQDIATFLEEKLYEYKRDKLFAEAAAGDPGEENENELLGL